METKKPRLRESVVGVRNRKYVRPNGLVLNSGPSVIPYRKEIFFASSFFQNVGKSVRYFRHHLASEEERVVARVLDFP